MSIAATILLILVLVVVAPVWIVSHYATRWRMVRSLSRDHERALSELWELAQRMEARVRNLERVLDAEAPGWRQRTEAEP